jgi:hypothetical protein
MAMTIRYRQTGIIHVSLLRKIVILTHYSIPTSLRVVNGCYKPINLNLIYSVANGGYDDANYS